MPAFEKLESRVQMLKFTRFYSYVMLEKQPQDKGNQGRVGVGDRYD